MEILSPKGHDLLRCMDDQKKKFVNNYQQLPTIFFAPLVAIAAVVIANTVSNRIEDN